MWRQARAQRSLVVPKQRLRGGTRRQETHLGGVRAAEQVARNGAFHAAPLGVIEPLGAFADARHHRIAVRIASQDPVPLVAQRLAQPGARGIELERDRELVGLLEQVGVVPPVVVARGRRAAIAVERLDLWAGQLDGRQQAELGFVAQRARGLVIESQPGEGPAR